jgi:plastocyanin
MTAKKETPKEFFKAQLSTKFVPQVRSWMTATIIGLALAALALSACGDGEASSAATDDHTNGPAVVIRDLAFDPETLTVGAGDTVTWRWDDGAIDHDVVGDGFRSDVMSEGTFRHQFEEPGTFEYECSLHPNMTGTIEVTG